jgi:hypothetical protein
MDGWILMVKATIPNYCYYESLVYGVSIALYTTTSGSIGLDDVTCRWGLRMSTR